MYTIAVILVSDDWLAPLVSSLFCFHQGRSSSSVGGNWHALLWVFLKCLHTVKALACQDELIVYPLGTHTL